MGLQDRDWYWAERDRKERENASAAPPSRVPRGRSPFPANSPFGTSGPGVSTRHVVLVLAFLALVALSFYAKHLTVAKRAAKEAAAIEQAAEAQELLAQRSAEALRLRLNDLAMAAEAEQARSAATKAELEQIAKARTAETTQRQSKWEKFYKPEPHCATSWTVDCANAFIRAKRKFSEQAPS